MLSVLTVLGLGANAFGIRWRPGRRYVSAFEATQPYGTARLAGLKVLVRSVCVLAALVAVGVSVWASQSFIAVDKGYAPTAEIADQPLRQLAACDRSRRRSADRLPAARAGSRRVHRGRRHGWLRARRSERSWHAIPVALNIARIGCCCSMVSSLVLLALTGHRGVGRTRESRWA